MANEVTLGLDFRNRRFKDAGKGLQFFAKELGRGFEGAEKVLRKELKAYLKAVVQALVQRHGTPYSSGGTGASLFRRTGGGLKELKAGIKLSGTSINTLVGSLRIPPGLAVHEKGKRVRPRRAQFLAVPLKAALTPRGRPKGGRASPRDWDNTFIQESRRGNLLVFQRKGSQIVPLFLLVREVQLPPRLKAQETLQAGVSFFVDKAVDKMAQRILKGKGK